jgi:hypothetical protein
VQWTALLSVFIEHNAAHKYAEKILYFFGCGWKGKVWEYFQVFFKERQQHELYHCKNFFFSLLLQTFSENMGQKFSLSF